MSSLVPLLTQLGSNLGLPGLAPDASGLCALSFDKLLVTLQDVPDRNAVILFAKIGALPEDVSPAVLRALLTANLFWAETRGATISLEPTTNAILVATQLSLSDEEYPKFHADLENFVIVAEVWTEQLAGLLAENTNGQKPQSRTDGGIGGDRGIMLA